MTTWNYNGWFGMDREIRLETGVFDEDARDVFCRGHCHSLALALEELISDATLYGLWEGGELMHVFVRLASADDAFIEILDHDDIEYAEYTGYFRVRRVEDAMPFARALIERERIEQTALALAA
jgi:hypothetical protein